MKRFLTLLLLLIGLNAFGAANKLVSGLPTTNVIWQTNYVMIVLQANKSNVTYLLPWTNLAQIINGSQVWTNNSGVIYPRNLPNSFRFDTNGLDFFFILGDTPATDGNSGYYHIINEDLTAVSPQSTFYQKVFYNGTNYGRVRIQCFDEFSYIDLDCKVNQTGSGQDYFLYNGVQDQELLVSGPEGNFINFQPYNSVPYILNSAGSVTTVFRIQNGGAQAFDILGSGGWKALGNGTNTGTLDVTAQLGLYKGTNYINFNTTNTPPASAVAPVRWVTVTCDGTIYRLPLYQ